MFRMSVVSVFVLITACGAGSDSRCTSDSQCSRGSFCDAHLGVCSSGGGASDGGSSGFGGLPGLGGGSGGGGLPASYGRACTGTCDTGTVCHELAGGTGACWSTGGNCPAGTVTPSSDATLCVRTCTSGATCPTGTACWDGAGSAAGNFPFPAGTKVCVPPSAIAANTVTKQPVGAACASNSDCANGICATSAPGGYCGGVCNSDADCGSNGACLQDTSSTSGAGACYAKCNSPGGPSSACRSGYTCAAITGVSWGVCWPQ